MGGDGFPCGAFLRGRDQSALEAVDSSSDGCGVETVVGFGERTGSGWWDDPGSDDAVVWCGGFVVDPFPSSGAGGHPVDGFDAGQEVVLADGHLCPELVEER